MREINASYVASLRVPKGTPAPKPFPGRFPTRISALWVAPDGEHSYIGKPNATLNRLLYTHLNWLRGFVEFDRAHKIMLFDPDKDGALWSRHLFPLYHPGVDGGPLDSFITKNMWLESLLRPRKFTKKFSYYLAPIQTRPSTVAIYDAKVANMLAGESAEQAANRAALKERLTSKRKLGYKFIYKVPF
jgi:hypothetical protein